MMTHTRGALMGALLLLTGAATALATPLKNPARATTTKNPQIPLAELRWLLKPLTQEQLVVEANGWQTLLQAKVREISNAEVTVLRQNQQIKQTEKAAKAAQAAKEAATKAETAAASTGSSDAKAQAAAEEAQKKAAEAARAVAKAQKLDAQAAADESSQAAREAAKKVAEEKQAEAAETGDTNAVAAQAAASSVASPSLENVSTGAVTQSSSQLENVASAVGAAAEKEAAEKDVLLEALTELRTQRAALIERFNLVLEELKAKGGDPAPYEQYRDSISEVIVDVSDTSAVWTFLTGWLTSDQGGVKWLISIVKFAAIIVVFWFLAGLVGKATRKATARSRGMSELLRQFLNTTIRRAVLVIGLLIAISAVGINIGPLLAVITAAGFVVGFALQGTLSNFASGLLMLIYRPFDVGDAVEAGGVSGSVTAMNLMTTSIRTWDNQAMIVPNNQIWGSVITNITGVDKRRVDMVFGIGYSDSMEQAEQILHEIVTQHPKVLKDPAPVIKVHELADSSVNFIVRPWTVPADYWAVYWDITRRVKEEFDKAGVSIPFPQRDVHLYQEKA